MYKGFCVVNFIEFGRMWPWWIHASRYPCKMKKCVIMAKVMTNSKYINGDYCYANKICSFCETTKQYDLPHLLFSCKKFDQERCNEWNVVKENIPAGLLLEIEMLNEYDQTSFIFSGMRSRYIKEFKIVYDTLLDFIYNMYQYFVQDSTNETMNT